MTEKRKMSNISLSKETIERLVNLKRGRDTYEDVVIRLLNFYERKQGETE